MEPTVATKRRFSELSQQDILIAKRVKEEEDTLVHAVHLSEETMTQITRLFKMIDRNSDGCLDIKDFSLDGEIITEPHYEMWREVRDKFDYDGDGHVTLEEFLRGFKKTVMKQEFRLREIPQKCTFEQFFKAVEIQINEQVQQLCQAALRWFSQA